MSFCYQHATITRNNDQGSHIATLHDSSLNGTHVNGKKINKDETCPLFEGDEIIFCKQKGFIVSFKIQQTTEDDTNGNVNYLELHDYMISIDTKSLNKLNTAQLMQRLRANNLEWKGLKNELIQRWRNYKLQITK